MGSEMCADAGCTRGVVARGYCDRHYRLARRRGEIKARERNPVARFWSNVDRTGDCWLWLKAKDANGYGRVGWDGKVLLAHRVAYELVLGPIPDGLPLDHLCRVTNCINPGHLEPVPTRENTARGDHPSATALRENRCVNGHDYTPENTYKWRGRRQCRQCRQSALDRRQPSPPVQRQRPSKVRVVSADCEVCGQTFEYPKLRRARTVCSDECRRVRHNRLKAASKARRKR